MMKNPATFLPWLPSGIAALDPALLDIETAMGNIRPVESLATLRADCTDGGDGIPTWLKDQVEQTCGLRLYPALGIAVQPVTGVIMAGCSIIAEYCCGMFNGERIQRSAAAIVANTQIHTFILAMATPGGYISGVEEAAAAVQAMPSQRKGLATIAYTQRLCASAGEWIAAGAELHYSAPSATRGSVGVIDAITDSTRAFQDAGLFRTVFTDGAYKAMGCPGVPVTDAQKAFKATAVAEASASFKGYLTARRNIPADAMQGQTFTARRAPAGFCDGTQFSDLEELMAIIAAGQL